jgi:hypothetical protein
MRKKIAYLVAVAALTFVVAAPALAAPSKGANAEVVPVTCGGVSQYVLVGIGSPAWGSDAGGNLDGTMYLVQEIDVRVYLGTPASEPSTPPIDGFSKTLGNKTGLGETIHCTFVEVETDENGTVTLFGDVWVVQVR